VATVSASGVVTALNAGTVTITARANDGSGQTASITLTVVYKYAEVVSGPPVSITLSEEDDFEQEIAKLPKTVTVKDSYGHTATASVTWDTSEYTGERVMCNVYGIITLPPGWEGSPDKYTIAVHFSQIIID
jgi:uncharacterized protein YjdB